MLGDENAPGGGFQQNQLRCYGVVQFSLLEAVHPISHSCVMKSLSAWNAPTPDTLGRKTPSQCDVSDTYA